jgi:hypothetical protein
VDEQPAFTNASLGTLVPVSAQKLNLRGPPLPVFDVSKRRTEPMPSINPTNKDHSPRQLFTREALKRLAGHSLLRFCLG